MYVYMYVAAKLKEQYGSLEEREELLYYFVGSLWVDWIYIYVTKCNQMYVSKQDLMHIAPFSHSQHFLYWCHK